MNHKPHLGEKLKQEADRLGLKPKDLAKHFGIQTPSIYDTLKHGRLDKKHYQALVALNSKPLEWWFDVEPPASSLPYVSQQGNVVREDTPAYAVAIVKSQQDILAELIELVQRLPRSAQNNLLENVRQQVAHYDQLYKELSEQRDHRLKTTDSL